MPRATRVLWWLALALLLAAMAGIDGVQRFVSDHNNFGDANVLAFAAAWLTLAAFAASRGFDALAGRQGAVRKVPFVAVLLLAALPYPMMLDSSVGYLLNAGVLALAVVLAVASGRAPSSDS